MIKYLPSWRTLLTSLLWGFSTPYWNYDLFILVALVPLLLEVRKSKSTWLAMLQTVWVVTLSGIITLFWIPVSLETYAPGLGVLGSWTLFLVLNLFAQPQAYVLTLLVRWFGKKEKNSFWILFLIALLFAASDIVYPKLLNDTLAHSLFKYHNLLTLISFPYGTYVLTFLLALHNLVIFNLITSRKYLKPIILFSSVVLFLQLMPPIEIKKPREKPIEVISINTYLKFEPGKYRTQRYDFYQFIKQSLLDLPESASERLVVFPETIYPFFLIQEEQEDLKKLNQEFLDIILKKKLHVFIGNTKRFKDGHLNGMIHLAPDEKSVQMQFISKKLLFPFGERIPLGEYLTFLKSIIPDSHVRNPGTFTGEIFKAQGLNIVSAMCYESLFPSFIHQFPMGIDLIINSSNEILFPRNGEPMLSFAQTVFTSAETRLPIIRTSNSGIGGYINRGKIIDIIEPHRPVEVRRYVVD